MPDKLPPEKEMINEIIAAMYNGGNEGSINFEDFLRSKNWEFKSERALERFRLKYLKTGWAHFRGDGLTWLKKEALHKLDAWGTYIDYNAFEIKMIKDHWLVEKKAERVKRRKESIEFILKNTSSIVAILLSLSTVIITIISIFDKRELKSLEQEVTKLKTAQDTLIQKLNLPKSTQSTVSIVDTAKK